MAGKKFYITTPIYYVNANPHIGHAYTQVIADSLSRYHRMLGEDVFFLTGTDEHGKKIEEASRKAGFAPGNEKDFVDTIVANFRDAWKTLNINYDHFIRTTDSEHEETVKFFLSRMKDSGDIYQGEYDGWYCVPCETFWTDKQSSDGLCPDCGRPVDRIKEKNYFFRTSKYQQWLIDHINKTPGFVMPEFRKNEVLGFLREELNDLCISRPKSRMNWGVELPFDTEYVVYVWFDALINYVSGLSSKGLFEEFWPADVHVLAKDIIRHHAVYWPIMLKSMGMELPSTIFAHGWWKMGEEKMSKSKGNSVDPVELVEKYGVDPVRYFLVKAISLGQDGSFSLEALTVMYNTDLANDLGNLLNRTLTMVEKYFEGISPSADEKDSDNEQIRRSEDLRDSFTGLFPEINRCLTSPGLLIREAVDAVMTVVGKANKYIEESAPWKYSKEGDVASLKLIMADLLEVLRGAAIGLSYVMPDSSRKIWEQLGLEGDIKNNVSVEELVSPKDISSWRRFPSGIKTAKQDPIFPRIKDQV